MLKYILIYIVLGFIIDYFYSKNSLDDTEAGERLYNVLFWPFRLFLALIHKFLSRGTQSPK